MAHPRPASSQRFGVALLRVSTDRQFQEGESIDTQRRKTEFVARRERIDIVRFFTEHYSGRKSDRRVLDDLFTFLADNRDITCVIVGDIDRFTRGGTEIYLSLKRRLRALDVALIDTTGIIQPERNRLEHLGVEYNWSVESPSHYAEIFMAEKARAEASDILTRTIGQQIQLTREGYQCRGANFGFRNERVITEDGKVDLAAADFILSEARRARAHCNDLHLIAANPSVLNVLERLHCLDVLGQENVHSHKSNAIRPAVVQASDPICKTCQIRCFNECSEKPGA